jgi:hypothetical protein
MTKISPKGPQKIRVFRQTAKPDHYLRLLVRAKIEGHHGTVAEKTL